MGWELVKMIDDEGKGTVGVAILGMGTVGTAVYRMLTDRREDFKERYGVEPVVRKVLVQDPEKDRGIRVPDGVLTRDPLEVLEDEGVDTMIEVIGGVELPFELVSRGLSCGKGVVTANKHLLAERGVDLERISDRTGAVLRYDASVGGIIPVFSSLGGGIHAMDVVHIKGILNGTTNFILSAMYNEDQEYEEALRQAQEKGMAEADPTMDVSGMDIAHKLCILSRLVFGRFKPLDQVEVKGISPSTKTRVERGKHRGKKVKLVGILDAREMQEDGLPRARVTLEEIGKNNPLYLFDGASNCIVIGTKNTGEVQLCGRGAGGEETATAVVSDLLSMLTSRRSMLTSGKRGA